MYTSAYALHEILVQIASKNKPKSRFLEVAAECLGLEGNDGPEIAAIRIRKLVIRVNDDLETLNLDEPSKKQFRQYLNPFLGLRNFSQMDQPLQQSKNGFLKAEKLNGLTLVHGALYGSICRFDLDLYLREVSSDIYDLKQKIADLDMPDDLKTVLFKRLSQLHSAVEHFKVFGADGLAEIIAELIGEIVIHVDSGTEHENEEWFSGVKAVCAYVFDGLEKARKATDNVRIVGDNVPQLAARANKLVSIVFSGDGGGVE